jgi:hypothetical protein
MSELLLGALLVLTVAWLVVRIRQNKAATKAESRPQAKNEGEYHAVAIKYSENACDAAKAMTGRRFLSNAAPRLPLPECDFLECRCQFAHYDDRRASRDRRSPFAPAGTTDGTGSYEQERREERDRRKQRDPYEW